MSQKLRNTKKLKQLLREIIENTSLVQNKNLPEKARLKGLSEYGSTVVVPLWKVLKVWKKNVEKPKKKGQV